eukprot:2766623-Amphidinium_carterae.2
MVNAENFEPFVSRSMRVGINHPVSRVRRPGRPYAFCQHPKPLHFKLADLAPAKISPLCTIHLLRPPKNDCSVRLLSLGPVPNADYSAHCCWSERSKNSPSNSSAHSYS